jgi:hypothetical protein
MIMEEVQEIMTGAKEDTKVHSKVRNACHLELSGAE